MSTISVKDLQAHRARTFHLPPISRLKSPAQALDFVKARGFVYFWPIKGIDLPSLWKAVAGDRPVADEHDDPGHVTWGWKDNALDKRFWYYAKVLRRKATMISLEVAPYFYALSENYGSPEEDYLIAYKEGRLTQAAKLVYEALLSEGRLNTLDLRRAARLANAKDSEFNRALEDLQKDFKILPVGVSEAGAWHYAFIYEVVARYYPELPEQARRIGEAEARTKLVELYFHSVGAAQMRDVNKLFGWGPELSVRAVKRLVELGSLQDGLSYPLRKGEWIALSELCRH
jgi:hypothetical protein